jgi:hypothetical protein
VQDLIALALHWAAGVVWPRLEVAETESVPANGHRVRRRHADVLYTRSALGKHDAQAVDHHRVFFTCESLPFEKVVPRWYEAHGRLEAATNMILGFRYAPARFIENNLLTAVGAAEVLHRGLRIDDEAFSCGGVHGNARRDARARPRGAQRQAQGSHPQRPGARDRLHALAARPDQEAIALLLPDVAQWAKRAAQAGNDLAHKGRTPNHSFEELIAVVEVTTAVVILNVLHELGLPPERQREIVQEHPQLRATSEAARDWPVAPLPNPWAI